MGTSLEGSIEGRREDISDCLLSSAEPRRALVMTGESRMAAEGRREEAIGEMRWDGGESRKQRSSPRLG